MYCGMAFEDGSALGRHVGAKHKKESRVRKAQEKEMRRTGMDRIVDITGKLTQEEYVAQNGEDGFFKLKAAMLEVALDGAGISEALIEKIVKQYNLNPVLQRDFNQLAQAIRRMGVRDGPVQNFMDIMVGWENNILPVLERAQVGGQRTYFGSMRMPGQYGMMGTSYYGGMGQSYDMYGNPIGQYGPRGMQGGGSPMGGMGPGMIPGLPLTMNDVRNAIRGEMEDKKKRDRIDDLEEKIDAIGEFLTNPKKRKGRRDDDDGDDTRYIDMQIPIKDPETGEVLKDDTGAPFMRHIRIPEDKFAMTDIFGKGENSEIKRLREEIRTLTQKPREDPMIKELKAEIAEQKKMYDSMKDTMHENEREAWNRRFEDMEKRMEDVGRNVGEWRNDSYRLLSGMLKDGKDIMQGRKPFREWAADVMMNRPQGNRVIGRGPQDVVDEFADESGLPVAQRPRKPGQKT